MHKEIDTKPKSSLQKTISIVLLLIPYLALLWVPFYNQLESRLFGFPYFYWYQLLWVPITSVIILIVYKMEEK